MASTCPQSTDNWGLVEYLWTTASSSNQNLDVDLRSNRHQVTAVPADTSAGTMNVLYKVVGASSYQTFSDTIDMTSGAATKIFDGMYESLSFRLVSTSTFGHSIKYSGWRE